MKLDLFLSDLKNGEYTPASIPSTNLYARAARLSDTHSPTLGTRSLDLMHVAAALILGAEIFLSFDSRQRAAARAEGLVVLP